MHQWVNLHVFYPCFVDTNHKIPSVEEQSRIQCVFETMLKTKKMFVFFSLLSLFDQFFHICERGSKNTSIFAINHTFLNLNFKK